MLNCLSVAPLGLVTCVSFLFVLAGVGLFVYSSGRVFVSLSRCFCWSLGVVFGGAGLSFFWFVFVCCVFFSLVSPSCAAGMSLCTPSGLTLGWHYF